MSNEENKRRILDGLDVPSPPSPRRPNFDPVKVLEVLKESKRRHGYGHKADRAHLEEMLARDDMPQFLRGHMQQALNRHVQRERIEAFVQRSTA